MHTSNSAAAERQPVRPLARIVWDRRASRHFEPTPIPDAELETMLALALQAPSAYNLQPWRFVVVRDALNRARLAQATNDPDKVRQAPAVVVAFGRRTGWSEHADQIYQMAADYGAIEEGEIESIKAEALAATERMPIALWLHRHVMTAFSYLMIAAESLGWDVAPMESFDPAGVREAVGLPEDAEVVALLAIGRRCDPERNPPGRLPRAQLVFSERYGNPWEHDDDDVIAAIDGMIPGTFCDEIKINP